MVRWPVIFALLAMKRRRHAQGPATTQRTTTLSALFPAAEAKALAATIDPGKPLRFRVRVPQNAASSGVLVFVKPIDSGELPKTGLRSSTATISSGSQRTISGMNIRARNAFSPQSRGSSSSRARSPRHEAHVCGWHVGWRPNCEPDHHAFSRAIQRRVVHRGRGFLDEAEEPLRPRITANRYVFITGTRDFNHRDMRRVFSKYQAAGATQALFMDLPAFGHEYPNAEQLGQAIDFLDAR
jgi:hypothetical protein